MKNAAILAVLIAFLPMSVMAQFDHDHKAWNDILTKHVRNGRVDYRAITKERKPFDDYLAQLAAVTAAELKKWTRDQKLAYWINAYNAYTLKAILDNYPIKRSSSFKARLYPANSIRQIDGVWDELKFRAGGLDITLNDMEHVKMRAELKEPRIHFAIVCASIGCPDLLNTAFRADGLGEQLDAAARGFIRNRQKVKVDITGKTIYLSKIFDWFTEDFDVYGTEGKYGKYNGVINYCLKHWPAVSQRFVKGKKAKIKWLDYDWSLNEQ